MRTAAFLLGASAAVTTAQAIYDNTTGVYHCVKPNTAFCAGDSLHTDIIIRCNAAGIGQPGRCTDNLSGQPPLGVKPALCYQPDATSGTAACEKNCVVYQDNGSSFTLPASVCTPTPEPTTTMTFIHPVPTTTITYTDERGVPCTTTYAPNPAPTKNVVTTTITYVDESGVTCTTGLAVPPETTLTTTFINPTQPHGPAVTGTGGGNGGYTNGTCVYCTGGNGNGGSGNGGSGNGGAPTKQPLGPTKVPDQPGSGNGNSNGGGSGSSSKPTGVVTAGASVHGIGGAAVLAMVAAYLL